MTDYYKLYAKELQRLGLSSAQLHEIGVVAEIEFNLCPDLTKSAELVTSREEMKRLYDNIFNILIILPNCYFYNDPYWYSKLKNITHAVFDSALDISVREHHDLTMVV